MNFERYTISTIIMMIICSFVMAVDYQVPMASTAPVIDGNSLPGEWDNALEITFAYPEILSADGTDILGTSPTHSDISADVKMLWDSSNLYVYVRVYDENQTYTKNAPGPYNGQDCFQIAFNLLNNASATFLADAPIYDFTPQTADGAGAGAYKHDAPGFMTDTMVLGAKEFADGWQMEIAIPFYSVFSHYANPGDRHGLGMILVDYDGGAVENFLTDYGSGENTIAEIATWNTITLIGENGCGVNGHFTGDINGDCYVDLLDFVFIATEWAQNTL